MSQPYHRYVFDSEKREFVGKFEEMYRGEDVEGYDSWGQEDLTQLKKQLSLAICGRYNFGRILDIGCGKGAFTHLLKKTNNYVMGIDVSETAIAKARERYPAIDFRKMSAHELSRLGQERFDLVVAMEILSYLEDWREVLRSVSRLTRYFYVTLYLPDDPIGFVKSFDELIGEMREHFVIETEVLVSREAILLFARVRE